MIAHFDIPLQGWRFIVFNLCLGLSHALVIFNAGAYIAMLPAVAAGLRIPLSFSTWTQTDYMIGLALGFPVGGWFSRRLGEYLPFVLALVAFALASLICATFISFYGYLAGRVLLGFAGGITLPLGQSLLIKEYPDRSKSIGIGVWSIFTLTPFTLGPPAGGWIADTLGWRWIFWLNIPLAFSIAGVVGALLYKRGSQRIRQRFDIVGFVLTALILFSFQSLLNQGNDLDWTNSRYLIGLFAFIVITLVYWVIWELSLRRPFVDISLFAQRNFTIGVIILFLGFMLFQGLLSMLIVQLQITLGYSSLLAGLVFMPMALFAKPLASVFHSVVKHIDARLLVSLNLLGFATTYFWLSRFDGQDAFAQIFWPKLLEGACLGSFFVPTTTLLLHGLPPERSWRAVELANLLRISAGAIGITLQGILLYQRKPLHITRFAEVFTDFDTRLTQTSEYLISADFNETMVIPKLAKLAGQRAVIHAMNDAYWSAGWVFVGLALLVWFANPTKQAMHPTLAQELRQETQELMAEEL